MNELSWLADSLRSGELPLHDYLDHLETRFNQVEPAVQAFVPESERFARLRREAEQLLKRYPHSESRPPLFGIPVAIKDIYQVRGFTTRAGSEVPAELLQGAEAAVVTALRKAGVLILGKSVTTEFAYLAPGPTRNPRNLSHTPGGSSSGSAAAVAAGLAPLALGSQTIGSVIRPAAFCGVVGFKPSYDRVARDGVIPLSPSLDHVGFFTTSVAGMLRVSALVCADWHTPILPVNPVLAVPEGPYLEQADPETISWFEEIIEQLGESGFTVRRIPLFSDFEELAQIHRLLMAAEAATVHADWFAAHDDLYRTETAALIARGNMVPAELVEAARAGRSQLRAALQTEMVAHGVDIWIAPAAKGPAPLGLETTGDPIMNLPWTYCGLPSVTVPAGVAGGLPLGLQLVGQWVEDEVLLGWAEAIEAVVRPQRLPPAAREEER
jgi:Asp-tRNA(Asn)/Glu-tRNA(Gln) amidotransferase A subunit family amidase